MISMKFIVGKLIHTMNLSPIEIQTSKSKKTIVRYEQYWVQIQSPIGDEIDSIINQEIRHHSLAIIYQHQVLD